MIRVEANTLEEAYSKAAKELCCSVTELELNVIQYPKGGFLGIGKKNAVVEAKRIGGKHFSQKYDRNFQNKNRSGFQNTQSVKKPFERAERYERKEAQKASYEKSQEVKKSEPIEEVVVATSTESKTIREPKESIKKREPINVRTPFDEQFHREKMNPSEVTYEIREKICALFENICFEITSVNVSVYDDDTLLIEIDGPDAALLIGKEGCRYKALSYMLYSWINIKYGLGVRLEIAEFLKNQEEMMSRYLAPIIERIYTQGRGQTKVLDGILIKIALERLRGEFPEKYVGIKNSKNGGRFIVINDFNRKNI